MRPVQITDVSRKVVTQDSLLLLNIIKSGPRYVRQLLARNGSSIRSKGGISLPNKIWSIILNFARGDNEDKFCLVKAELVSTSPDVTVLRCFRHEFDPRNGQEDEFSAGSLPDQESVWDFEKYLECATSSTTETLSIKLPKLSRLSGPDNTFDFVLDTTSKNRCLYAFLNVPDIIAHIENGACDVCGEDRFICPGCTGGVAEMFDAFMGCGVDLACPLCMGLELCLDHKGYLECHYWNAPPKDEAENMWELLEDRLLELGYKARPKGIAGELVEPDESRESRESSSSSY
ncbi:hypothetical protein F4805DRAFT_478744 [Annulohypoxylon moriforme]|nr:hypothetical protein F4805DRAFT_478744 [Annulohypoxylon moriforme]